MEFVAGRDLGSWIAREARIDRDKLARELLGAVAHIHAAGIVHRDIKPHNIVLEADRTAKLIDFGIALPPDATSLTQTGLILATKRYAAPEVMAGRPANERSDLYSCGMVLRACGSGGSAELGRLVDALTEEDPADRPRTARQALTRLEERPDRGLATEAFSPTFERPLDRERAAEPEEAHTPPTRVYSRSSSNRKRWLAGSAILGVAAALAIAVILAAGSGGSGGSSPGAKKLAEGSGKAQGQPGKKFAGATKEAPTGTGAGAGSAEGETVVASETPAAAVPVPGGNDPALGSALNQEGFELIQAGSYEEAIPILEESVRAFPAGTEETEYAYALFNLGDALRLGGRPEAAIPVLEERLQIPDQTDVVERELEAARSEAG